MKKSVRKAINNLKRYIGHEIIRIKPTNTGVRNYENECIFLTGFTSNGCIKCRETGVIAEIFGNEEQILPIEFTDYSWISYEEALKKKHSKLDYCIGKKIKRVCPTVLPNGVEDYSYTDPYSYPAPTLILVSEHHMLIEWEGRRRLLAPEYSNPDDWELAE